jgi:ribosomal protein S18 acetylase RimI-like enzyme
MTAAPELEVARLGDGLEEAVGAMLARAFAADPIFTFIEPDREKRVAFLALYMAALTRRSHRLAVAYATSPEIAGVSLWKTPELRALTAEQLAMTGLDRTADWLSVAAYARHEAVFDPILSALDRESPEPVWYLGVLGVDPAFQGRGLGSRLMTPVLERADREGIAVTLETAQPRNLPLYRRHGFEVMSELPPPAPGGPVVWTMKRFPRLAVFAVAQTDARSSISTS